VELGLYDAAAGVGKLNGLDVVVANAASQVGKKAKVHIGRVLDGHAFATLVVADGKGGVAPITFEGEAEKPTRAPARRKDAALPVEVAPETEAESEVSSGELEPEIDEHPEDAAAGEAHGAAPAKKRTRRGSRGGRRRKKPAAAAEGAEAPTADEGASESEPVAASASAAPPPTKKSANRPRAPRIHVPPPEAPAPADDAEVEVERSTAGESTTHGENTTADGNGRAPAKRKTRRGSRGGRNRRRKPAATAAGEAAATEPDSDGIATTPEAAPVSDTGYVPMSEWLDDLEP
ncbi:MAG TPA: hypothetical protein VEH79_00305, partial [Gaiellaceae bacterium]|nr:hypothetical protein [Gaiellaceae bacterium]